MACRGAMTKVLFLIVLAIALSGCAPHPVVPYDTAEKVLLGAVVGGQIWDLASTEQKLGEGCIEANPILGEHPSDAALVGSKVLAIWITYLGANAIDNHAMRKIFLGAISAIGIGAGIHNSQVDCQ